MGGRLPSKGITTTNNRRTAALLTMDNTPLLASDNGDTPPSLSYGPPENSTLGEEGLALLLASGGDHPKQYHVDGVVARAATPTPQEPPSQRAFFIIFGGALSLLQMGFVWGSYLVPSWSDTILNVSIKWLGSTATTAVIRSTNLGMALELFFHANRYTLVALLVVSAVIIPCLSMVWNPVRIVIASSSFSFLEVCLRFCLLVVYVLGILDLMISFVDLQWTDTSIFVKNQIRGGLVAYIVGISSSMLVATLVRIRRVKLKHQEREAQALRRSFQATDASAAQGVKEPNRSCFQQILIWEFGLLAVVLLVPIMTLPLFELKYSGLAAQFMSDPKRYIYMHEIPLLLWKEGMTTNTPWYFVAASVVSSVMFVTIVPIVSLILGVIIMCSKNQNKHELQQVLYCLHPTVNSLTFGLAVLIMVPSLSAVGNVLFNKDEHGVCKKFENVLGESCLSVQGTILWGGWCCLIQAVALEVFITMIVWS